MTTYYFDTSAIAKRYLIETGAAWVKSIAAPSAGHVVIVCDLTPVEFFSLLYRRVRDGSITPADALTLQTGYLFDHEEEYLSVPLSMDVLTRARSLLAQYPLRSLDALQLAGAVEATRLLSEPMIFVSSDRNLLSAAMGEGFNTDNPLLHP